MFGFKKKDRVADFITGAPGRAVLDSVADLTLHFTRLDGWDSDSIEVAEVFYLAAFLAWVTLRNNRVHFGLTSSDIPEVAYGLVQSLCLRYGEYKEFTPAEVRQLEHEGGDRLKDYDAIWNGGHANGSIAFQLHAFSCVQGSEDFAGAILAHMMAFPLLQLELSQKLRSTT